VIIEQPQTFGISPASSLLPFFVSFLAYLHSFYYGWLFIGERYTDMYPCTNDERWILGFGCSWVWDFDLMILSYLIGCDRVRFGNLCLGWASYLIASVAFFCLFDDRDGTVHDICNNLRFFFGS